MSDKNQDNPDDIELNFDVASDDTQDKDSYASGSDEYDDIDEGDNEDGIFAPEHTKEKSGKSSGLLGAVALLAVVGAGGYVYYSNPQMIEQVQQNILGAEIVADSSVEQVVEAVVDPAVDVPETTGVAPDATTPDAVADATKVLDESVQQDVALNAPSAEIVPIPAVVPPVENVQADVPVETVKAPDAAPDVMPETTVMDAAPIAPEKTDALVEVKPDAEPKKEEVVAPAVKEIVAEEKPVIVESKEAQQSSSDLALDKYFDSPSGKILKDMPAPSMNAKKGKNESIIVVGKQPQKSRSEYGQSAKVSIQTTGIENKVISANRALSLSRYDAAKEMFDELYRLNPRDGRVLMGRAVLFHKMGQQEQAISAYEEVLKYNPDNAEAVVNLAGLIRKQYPAVALNKLLDLRQQYPDNAVVAAQLGVAYADTANYTDAFHYLSMAASMEPSNPQHYFNMAIVSEKAGDPQKAIQNYEKALEADAISGSGGKTISRELIYDRLARLRGN